MKGGPDRFNVEDAGRVEDGEERLDQLRLGHRLHALGDDVVQAIGGGLAQRLGAQEAHQQVDEAQVGDERDVDPGDVRAHHLQRLAHQVRVRRLVRRLREKKTFQSSLLELEFQRGWEETLP